MAEMELDLNRVASEESVARVIFSPSYIFKGRVSPTAFRWDVLPSGDAEDAVGSSMERTGLMWKNCRLDYPTSNSSLLPNSTTPAR